MAVTLHRACRESGFFYGELLWLRLRAALAQLEAPSVELATLSIDQSSPA